jgi:hypothetical protein
MHSAIRKVLSTLVLSTAIFATRAQSEIVWQVGTDDEGWPVVAGNAGGPDTAFVQENGTINALPGDPIGPDLTDPASANQHSDNDYYFAGVYTTAIDAVTAEYGPYDPVGVVTDNEQDAERAFAGGDLDLRYHFNLPDTFKDTDLLSVTFDPLNLDTSAANTDPRFGIEVWVNGVKVQDQIVIRGAQLNKNYTTPQFTVAQAGIQVGPGFDNIVSLHGISYNGDGGGNWMGIDYVQLNHDTAVIPPAVFPWAVGKDDDSWTGGTGGGENANFVQPDGATNTLPGSATAADDDYYLAGSYTTTIPSVVSFYADYTPIGTVAVNEDSAEGGVVTADNELRYHFNLPNTMKPTDLMAVQFEPLALDTTASNPHYGVEVYVNGVKVQPETVITAGQLKTAMTTPQFSLSSVNAQVGAGPDNIVTIRGIPHTSENGGNSLTFDYVKLIPVAHPVPPPILPWTVGKNDNAQPTNGSGGGPNANFLQENGTVNPLPGSPTALDNDYYLAGVYSSVITGNGTYTPVGAVPDNEDSAERAVTAGDTEQRYHFNLPASLQPTDKLSLSFSAVSLDTTAATPLYGVELYVNNVKVLPEVDISPTELNTIYRTPAFSLADVNAQAGPGFDNIVTLKGINKNADGGGNWMGIDYIEMDPVLPPPFPWQVGKDDNTHITNGKGGGPNANFVQENGNSNPLPGNPNSPAVDQQADDDYYFAGTYTTPIQSVVDAEGAYDPVGVVLVNENAAERAFAGSDNTKRYHFNLPTTLQPTNELAITVDFNNLDTSGANPRYGFQVLFNDVLLQDEIVVDPTLLDHKFTTAPFTLASVNAQTGSGFDNIVTLQGINHSGDGDGAGQWMGIDFVMLNPINPPQGLPIQIGKDDEAQPLGDGGGPNASFVQENGNSNPLPGNPYNIEVNQQADDDYYFAGTYTNVIDSVTSFYGDYTPVGLVPANEEAVERAFAGSDNEKRYHFNLPDSLQQTDKLVVTYDPLNLDDPSDVNTDPQYGIEVYFNGVQVQPEKIIRPPDLNTDISTAPFTLASVNAKTGSGYDNILTLRGINHSAEGGGNWMGFDYIKVDAPAAARPQITAVTMANGKITVTWTGGGTLQTATDVAGPWTLITTATGGTYTADITTTENRYFRVMQ